jgi:hypothetical protein
VFIDAGNFGKSSNFKPRLSKASMAISESFVVLSEKKKFTKTVSYVRILLNLSSISSICPFTVIKNSLIIPK